LSGVLWHFGDCYCSGITGVWGQQWDLGPQEVQKYQGARPPEGANDPCSRQLEILPLYSNLFCYVLFQSVLFCSVMYCYVPPSQKTERCPGHEDMSHWPVWEPLPPPPATKTLYEMRHQGTDSHCSILYFFPSSFFFLNIIVINKPFMPYST
jgi:hypothetical protein